MDLINDDGSVNLKTCVGNRFVGTWAFVAGRDDVAIQLTGCPGNVFPEQDEDPPPKRPSSAP